MDISDLLSGKKKKAKAPGGAKNSNKKKKDGATSSQSQSQAAQSQAAEDDVLASLGTRRAETTSYESDVLRQATLKLAPNLKVELDDNDDDNFLGFPDFITETSLLPFSSQKQGKANRQVVLKVLEKVQSQIKNNAHDMLESNDNTMRVLAMKQNILLSMLGRHSKKPAIQQVWKETKHTLSIYQQYEQANQPRKRISMMERKQIPGAASLAKAQQLAGNKRGKKLWKDWSSDEEDDDDDNAPKTRPVLAEMNYSRRRMGKLNGANGKKAPRRTVAKRTRSAAPRKAAVGRNITADMMTSTIKSTTSTSTTTTARTRPRRNNRTPVASYADDQDQNNNNDDDVVVLEEEDENTKKEQLEFDLRNVNEQQQRPRRQNRTKVVSYAETTTEDDEHMIDEAEMVEDKGETAMEVVEPQQQGKQQQLDNNENDGKLAAKDADEDAAATALTAMMALAAAAPPPQQQEQETAAEPKSTNSTTNINKAQLHEVDTTTTTQQQSTTTTRIKAEPTTGEDSTPPLSNDVTCPICQNPVNVSSDPSEADGQLAQHMAECQQNQSSTGTSSSSQRRTSSRKRTRPTNGYKEVDDDDGRFDDAEEEEEVMMETKPVDNDGRYDDADEEEQMMMETEKPVASNHNGRYDDADEDEMMVETKAIPASRNKRRRRSGETATTTSTTTLTPSSVDANDEIEADEKKDDDIEPDTTTSKDDDDKFVFDADMGEEEEDENIEIVEEEEEEEEVPLMKPTAIDDYLLDDYEDRVDYWRLYGVSEMRDMSRLRADGETDPGAVMLPGGLHIPAWMNNRLFGYQRTGLEWMWTLHQQQAGGVMGDEMGLGKTVQVSSFLGAMAASRQLKGVLIISPATMLQHWLSELTVWAPGLRRVLLHSSGDSGSSVETPRNIVNQGPAIFRNLRDWLRIARKEKHYEKIESAEGNDVDDEPEDSFCGTGYAIVTTYEHVRRNQDDYVNHPWSYVVMDEAQKIRNPTADITLACKRLRTPHRIAMTGTPIQNDLKELWSLFDFVFPGRLGTLPAFEEEFAGPIKRGGYSNASPVQVQLAYRCSLVLRDLIDPYLLRRQKAEIDEVKRMPSKTEHVLFCRLSKRQRRMYESFLKSDMVKKIFKGSTMLFAAVTMLRKICNHPDLVLSDTSEDALEAFLRNGCVPEETMKIEDEDDEDEDDYNPFPDVGDRLEERSGKFEVMAKILPLWKKQGHRVLIFSQWTKMLNIIQQFVVAQGWKFLRLDGKTSVANRQKLVDKFNSDKSYFGMLCTTRTGGVGLNLTGANKLVLYDVDWNPQTDAQARERAWRFGQEKQVTVYRLCTAGTIEEKMYQRQIFKTALTNKVLHDPRQKRLFSQKDLHDLLTLQPDNGRADAGGEEMIETTERLARASGKDEGAGSVDASEVSKDDGETLASVLKSKGLAGVFDHNFVDPSGAAGNKSKTVKEMEEQAKQIAKEAAEALRASVDAPGEDDPFTPTWTGAPESRFGGGNNGRSEKRGSGSSFGGAGTAGVRNANGLSKSSGSLLASIRQQNEAVKSGWSSRPSNDGGNNGKNNKYTKLLVRIRDYVRKHKPTSDEILDAFSSIPDGDAAIFKRLLNSIAKVEQGRWYLLPEHR